ncbi:DUF7557 family protein [Candidatus Nitrosarchaeum limnium]|jgi:hypothetical protein|uniref:Toxin-antitoxin system, antitoxin component, ribbon-helix-helix domain protein n=1 Tax=Candidatus Nitrosarchaeum limnium BG20 TaxID=859192 RepID=S2EI44_9ARCH|nr:hypothetical protein [Candidatus Nitrosarchaeum limnium]EPA04432.1 toxin-antitoxin system, antitoxin component, ribbon-helix-helix domain protein [Candidatus Nitrosarchaeum limnium BG20]
MYRKTLHEKRTTIVLQKQTRDRLASLAKKDQTFDEVVRLLIEEKEGKVESNP